MQITLKQLRKSKDITQSELADVFNVSVSTIANYEMDSSNIKDSLLKKYMDSFNVTYDQIFLGNKYEIFEFECEEKSKILSKV
ncbi:helix-turn-helix domain-containing protein [Aerococcus kribbianus]|uniref:Helix-turn-helix transcriptional regulator n=1 Tax=Aerococcus kribbianus TaxID=2999064 RepID=A0A9X3JGA3_9LACT|nr:MULTISPECIES: helix-turn-helix transcriptional regulator [unclassified Aerococcus]MCZ0717863.1 helix-turn-helix transcriptional regulator [Aerococcus sp. YH-aer221]MCZ0726150.1 helix-turn-helix transcriptional regulator [Aerococcus sp. YH-aer222]